MENKLQNGSNQSYCKFGGSFTSEKNLRHASYIFSSYDVTELWQVKINRVKLE